MDNQQSISGISSNDYFADALVHESIRESGTPYRSTVNEVNREQVADESDIHSVYKSL